MKKFKILSSIFLIIMSLGILCSCSGEQGPQGEQGIQGEKGEDGHAPVITIGENGNWYIDGVDTGVNAKGESSTSEHNGTYGLEFYPINEEECAVGIGSAIYAKEIVIPQTYRNYTVTTIAGNYNGFSNSLHLEKICIPESITTIEKYAFSNCPSLNYVFVPKTVINMESSAFSCGSSLTLLCEFESKPQEWSDSWTNSPIYWNFTENSKIVDVDDMTYLLRENNEAVLTRCNKQTGEVIIKEFIQVDNIEYKITSIGKYAFADNPNIKMVFIPKSIKNIEKYAFLSDSNYLICCEAETRPDGWDETWNDISYTYKKNPVWNVSHCLEKEGIIYLISEGEAIVNTVDESLEEVIISSEIIIENNSFIVTTIDEHAFSFTSNMKSLSIPKTITKVYRDAFVNCINLEKVYYEGTIEDWCKIKFDRDGYSSNVSVTPMFFASKFYIKNGNAEYVEVTNLEISGAVEIINNGQFKGFSCVENIVIKEGVTKICENAFVSCYNLKTIVIPLSVTIIESGSFSDLSTLTFYCEAESKPTGWVTSWNSYGAKVYWAGQWEYDANGNPVPLS